MRRVPRRCVILAICLCACGGPEPSEPPAPALSQEQRALVAAAFVGGSDGLSERDQADIAGSLGMRVRDDGALVDEVCGEPLRPELTFPDLDDDGTAEVVVDAGNTCTSGMAGTSVWVFVRDARGRLQPNLGFPGMIAEVLPTRSLGFPDLLIGGPGFCFPVWRWNGREYAYLRNDPQAPGGCDNR